METPGKFGRYEILERVGRGGMGVLYRGRDPVLDREVAIKVMLGDFSTDEAARTRFFREARAAARLQHRNIVTIFEFAEDEHGTPYIAMEFLRGRTLATRLSAEPPLTMVQKLDIVVQLCTGLHYAHEQGIVHRDVKPANIWLMDDGTVKLLDFGIAKMAASTVTQSAGLMGSASYMAPEQVSGREIDGRADVFATGVVLYEMLAGRKPFEGEGPTVVMRKIVSEAPAPIRDLAPDVPPALALAVARALEKDPEKRYMHAGDFGAELRLIRLSLERSSDTIVDEFDTPTAYVAAGAASAPSPARTRPPAVPPRAASVDPLAEAPLGSTAAVPGAAAQQPPLSTWIAGAALAVALLVALLLWFDHRTASRSTEASGGTAAGTAAATRPAGGESAVPATEAAGGAPARDAAVQLVSEPSGAVVTIDGRDAGVTPTSIPAAALGDRRVIIAKRGFKSVDVRAGTDEIRDGVVQVRLEPEESGIPVQLSGSYPFEVLDGGRVISNTALRHEFTLPAARVLRLRSSEYLLDQPIRVDARSGRFSYALPDAGRLTIRTPLETCRVSIGGRDVGFPPIADQKVAAGTYRIELTCPDGQGRSSSVSIAPGQSRLEVIR